MQRKKRKRRTLKATPVAEEPVTVTPPERRRLTQRPMLHGFPVPREGRRF